MILQSTSKKLESHLRHANAIRRLSMKKYLSEQKPTFWTATAGVSRDAR